MASWDIDYTPSEKQRVLHSVRATQILYGGAAGGGKSHGLRMDAILACLQNPGCKAYIFRKTLPEIDDNHITPLKMMMIPEEVATLSETKKTLNFANGSILRFCFSEDDATIHKFQGAEIHFLGVDEAALMSPYQLRFLISRVRLGSWTPKQDGYFPRIVFTSNPGGPSHSFLKRKFIDASPRMTYFYDKSTASKENTRGWRSIVFDDLMGSLPGMARSMCEVIARRLEATTLKSRRAEAKQLSGNLQFFDLANVIQTLIGSHQTGSLVVSSPSTSGCPRSCSSRATSCAPCSRSSRATTRCFSSSRASPRASSPSPAGKPRNSRAPTSLSPAFHC